MFSPGFGPLVTPEPDVVVAGPEVGEPENGNTPIYFICTQINENAQIKMQKQSDAVNDMKWIVRGDDATDGINV